MKVRSLMTADVAVCQIDEPMINAARVMWERDCGFVAVVKESNDNLVGVITDRDMCMAALTRGLPLDRMAVADAMHPEPCVCRADDLLTAAHRTMREHQLRRLPVLDEEDKLVGVVTLNDLARNADKARGTTLARKSRAVSKTLAAVCAPHPVIEADDEPEAQV